MQGYGVRAVRKKGFELQSSYFSSSLSTSLLSMHSCFEVLLEQYWKQPLAVSLWELCLRGHLKKEFMKISRTSGHPLNQSVAPTGLLDTGETWTSWTLSGAGRVCSACHPSPTCPRHGQKAKRKMQLSCLNQLMGTAWDLTAWNRKK